MYKQLKDRLKRHPKGLVLATKKRLPVKPVSYFALPSQEKAFSLEHYFKTGAGRVFLEKRIF